VSRDAEEKLTRPPAVLPVDTADRAPVGQRIQGRYRIVSELGAGAFGLVCLAEDEATSHWVAIRLLPRAAPPAQRVGRSLVTASTAHPGLAHVLEFGEVEPGRPFVAVELVEGRRLSNILSEGKPLDVGAALRIALEIGEAVETLHHMGLVHGALRPRNVMVLADGRVKLMDVELIGLRDASAPTAALAAEPPAEYLSPEQVRGDPLAGGSDTYAFAVILYEMLCGVPPLQAATREAGLVMQLTETPPLVRRRRRAVSVPLESIVALSLSKDPARRPPMQDILDLLWAEANRPPSQWKRRAAIIGGTTVAVSLAVVGAWSLFASPPPLWSPPPPLVQPAPTPTPRPTVTRAPVSAPPAPRAPAVETPPAPPSSSSRLAKPARREQVRPPQAPASDARERSTTREQPAAREQPASSNTAEGDDPGAVIDWLRSRSSPRGQ
jgi:serine/threonine protein kinase